jgi:opacity protein-like surface antigen
MRSMLLAAVTVACCSVAQAQNPARGWYVGFDAGMSRLDGELDDRDNQATLPFDDDSATLAAHAGYRFNRFLQLGVFYADYGNFSGRDSGYALDVDLRGVGLEFTLRIPVGEKFGVLGEVFAMNRRLDISAVAPGSSVSDWD